MRVKDVYCGMYCAPSCISYRREKEKKTFSRLAESKLISRQHRAWNMVATPSNLTCYLTLYCYQ